MRKLLIISALAALGACSGVPFDASKGHQVGHNCNDPKTTHVPAHSFGTPMQTATPNWAVNCPGKG